MVKPRFAANIKKKGKEMKRISLIAVGHDHNNSFVTAYDTAAAYGSGEEVLLSYGRTSGVNAWSRDIPIGASVYTVHTDKTARRTFTTSPWSSPPSSMPKRATGK